MLRGTLLILLALSPAAHAQTVKAQGPRGQATMPTYQPRQPYNSMAKDTTPLNCDQYRNHPYPNMQRICQNWENAMVQGDAQRQGRPGPSSDIVDLRHSVHQRPRSLATHVWVAKRCASCPTGGSRFRRPTAVGSAVEVANFKRITGWRS